MLTYYCILMLTTPFLFLFNKSAISKKSFCRPCSAKMFNYYRRIELTGIIFRSSLFQRIQGALDFILAILYHIIINLQLLFYLFHDVICVVKGAQGNIMGCLICFIQHLPYTDFRQADTSSCARARASSMMRS